MIFLFFLNKASARSSLNFEYSKSREREPNESDHDMSDSFIMNPWNRQTSNNLHKI